MPVNPQDAILPISIYVAGHQNYASLDNYVVHPNGGNWTQTGGPTYTQFALSPPTGYKQKVIHSRGTNEIQWSLSGEVTTLSLGLALLMSGSSRGRKFDKIVMKQGIVSWTLEDCYWDQFSLSGGPDKNVSFQISGRSTKVPRPSHVLEIGYVTTTPLAFPSWTSGNAKILDWTLAHKVSLSPVWSNSDQDLPAYYRPGESEFDLSITTLGSQRVYSTIDISIGLVSLVNATVTNTGFHLGGRGDTYSYKTTLVNATLEVDPLTGEFLPSASEIILRNGFGVLPIPGVAPNPAIPGQAPTGGILDSPGIPAPEPLYWSNSTDAYHQATQFIPDVSIPSVAGWPGT